MSGQLKRPALSVLIPAAGGSERLGQAKQLVMYKGRTLIENAVSLAHSLSPLEVIVVTGAYAGELRESVDDSSVRWVNNPRWSEGMGGSIALGAKTVSPEASGVLILLCDQWRVEQGDLQGLVLTWASDPSRVVVSKAGERYMPPVIFPSDLFGRLRDLQGDQGARSLFREFPKRLEAVPVENAGFDLDTPEQLGGLS